MECSVADRYRIDMRDAVEALDVIVGRIDHAAMLLGVEPETPSSVASAGKVDVSRRAVFRCGWSPSERGMPD